MSSPNSNQRQTYSRCVLHPKRSTKPTTQDPLAQVKKPPKKSRPVASPRTRSSKRSATTDAVINGVLHRRRLQQAQEKRYVVPNMNENPSLLLSGMHRTEALKADMCEELRCKYVTKLEDVSEVSCEA